MLRRAVLVLGSVSLGLAGCASKPRAVVPTTQPLAEMPATTAPDPADLALDELQPAVSLPTPRPADQATTRPSLDALTLYAQARDAQLAGQRFTAIGLLRQALLQDPDSFALHYALGEVLTGNAPYNEQAIKSFQDAARLDPDNLAVQTELGRQFLAKGDTDKAIEHLRLALLTGAYNREADTSALAEYLLARALQDKGYDTAALQVYERLMGHMRGLSLSNNGHPELASLLVRPEALFVRVAQLYEKHEQHDEALRAYSLAAEQEPTNFAYQANVVRTLMDLGRTVEAREKAGELVDRFRASNETLRLLRETFAQSGGDQAVADELADLHQEDPADTAILFAFTDVLHDLGRDEQAEQTLREAVEASEYDIEIVRRLYNQYMSRNDTEAAARLLIVAVSERPETIRDMGEMWDPLLRASTTNRLRLPDLQALDVPPRAEAAKMFWVSRIAELWNRSLLARSALQQAVKTDPPFPPAYRALLNSHWGREDWDEARKIAESEQLITQATDAGNEALAAELRGILALNQDEPVQALAHFMAAERRGAPKADVRMERATALLAADRAPEAEQLLWRLVEEFPTYEDAYGLLFRYYLERHAVPQSLRVLRAWLQADPSNVNAKLIEASFYARARQFAAAEAILLSLFQSHSDQAAVLMALQSLYEQTGRLQEYIGKLEQERSEHPENRAALEQLLEIYRGENRSVEATQVLDAAREAVKDDPDLLYYIAHLYTRIGQKETMEQTLERVLQIHPHHAPAANDLGYNWADEGRNLDRAEELIRIAVEAEPDNQSFLDSLGWVLYKRGKFEEARQYLQEAIEPATFPDPVVLDHLGDTLYRLNRPDDARAQWERAQQRLEETGADREDLRDLGLQLQKKLDQLGAGEPVPVAPTADTANDETPQQAKN